jgi:hypothetical protein
MQLQAVTQELASCYRVLTVGSEVFNSEAAGRRFLRNVYIELRHSHGAGTPGVTMDIFTASETRVLVARLVSFVENFCLKI